MSTNLRVGAYGGVTVASKQVLNDDSWPVTIATPATVTLPLAGGRRWRLRWHGRGELARYTASVPFFAILPLSERG